MVVDLLIFQLIWELRLFLLCKRLRFKTLNIICRANFLYSSVQCYNYILFEINLLVFFQVCITVWMMCPASLSPVRIIFLKIIFAFISYYIFSNYIYHKKF